MTKKNFLRALSALALLSIIFLLAFAWHVLRGGERSDHGEIEVSGVLARVEIERDANAVPSIKASSRSDVAFALGFLHAQERFLQMDISRRLPAGELSALLGVDALHNDLALRPFALKSLAKEIYGSMQIGPRTLLDAYAKGVNEGLRQMPSKPHFYWSLQLNPEPWLAIDSILVLLGEYNDNRLQSQNIETASEQLQTILAADWWSFLTQDDSDYYAPLVANGGAGGRLLASLPNSWPHHANSDQPVVKPSRNSVSRSNMAAVAGDAVKRQAPILAMSHSRPLALPGRLFRVQWTIDGGSRPVIGTGMVGVPILSTASNGELAWVAAPTGADLLDLVKLKVDASGKNYQTVDGEEAFKYHQETLKINGQSSKVFTVPTTRWGPVILGRGGEPRYAIQWMAQAKNAVNLQLLELEAANNIDEAVAVAQRRRGAHLNFFFADSAGEIAWTTSGALPQREGFTGRQPQDRHSGTKRWRNDDNGFFGLSLLRPVGNRLWSADARLETSGRVVGDGGFAHAGRQDLLKRQLTQKKRIDMHDLWGLIASDDVEFYRRWQTVLRAVVDRAAHLAHIREYVDSWDQQKPGESVGFGLVVEFRKRFIEMTIGRVISHPDLFSTDPWAIASSWEYPAWQLAINQPANLIPTGFKDWDDFLISVVDEVIATRGDIALQTWSERQKTELRYPISGKNRIFDYFYPPLAAKTDGAAYLLNQNQGLFGEALRVVMVPNDPASNRIIQPFGQSASFRNKDFRSGHAEWLNSTKSMAFQPMESVSSLRLRPSGE